MGLCKLDNLCQHVDLVEKLRASTILIDLGYNFIREVDKYIIEVVSGSGKGHPGNKNPNSMMFSAVGLGLEMAYKGWPVELVMGVHGIIRATT